MNNAQLFYQTGLPVILILVGIILNERNNGRLRDEINGLRDDLRGEIKGLRDELRGEIKGLRSEMMDLRRELHEGLAALSSRIDRIDSDLAAFYKMIGVLEGRVEEISKK